MSRDKRAIRSSPEPYLTVRRGNEIETAVHLVDSEGEVTFRLLLATRLKRRILGCGEISTEYWSKEESRYHNSGVCQRIARAGAMSARIMYDG